MQIEKLKKCTDWFRVNSMRSLDDPCERIDRKEMVVALDQYPYDFGLGPNPREPMLTSPVSKKIAESLEENGEVFHLLNRGITIVAKGLEFDNKTQRVRLQLDESEEEKRDFGILDGGNTNARINKYREDLDDDKGVEELEKRFVNVQVLVPRSNGSLIPPVEMQNLLNDIKEARNTSIQVKSKSLADARRHFDALKAVVQDQPYFEQISWHEGQPGSVDALLIITLLMIYYPRFSDQVEGREPSNAYGHKERCLSAFLQYAEQEPDELVSWITIVPKLLELFDEIQVNFPQYYGGRFGKIKEVQIYDERRYERGNKKYRKSPPNSQFTQQPMKYSYPTGWIYPIFAAFRVIVGPKEGGEIQWKRDPIEFWRKYGEEICNRYEPHLQAAGYDSKKVATNLICYQAMRQGVTDLYKDQLLKEAGINA
jgi:AIPR protein